MRPFLLLENYTNSLNRATDKLWHIVRHWFLSEGRSILTAYCDLFIFVSTSHSLNTVMTYNYVFVARRVDLLINTSTFENIL